MDPHLYAEQPGLRPDAQTAEDGTRYLRHLKEQVEEATPALRTPAGSPAIMQQTAYSGKERRKSPRFRCTGSVEFKAEGSDVRMWGTLTDVSLHGCYVEMSTTFPVGTKVELGLEAMQIRVHAKGTVRVSYPFLGMGICLTDMEPGQQAQLEQMLSAVAGDNAAPDPALARDGAGPDCLAAVEPSVFLAELKQFFDCKKILSREEYLQIAKRCRRS